MIQRDASECEKQHRNKANRRADPVPLMQMSEPEGPAFLIGDVAHSLALQRKAGGFEEAGPSDGQEVIANHSYLQVSSVKNSQGLALRGPQPVSPLRPGPAA